MHHVRIDFDVKKKLLSFFVALLTRLAVVNYDIESVPLKILIKADWSDNNSTLTWKTPNDIRSFHLQV